MFDDLDQGDIWFVEVAATDGVMAEDRREMLVARAEANKMSTEHCRFVTAFSPRTSAAVRNRIGDIS